MRLLMLVAVMALSACHAVNTIERPTIDENLQWQTPVEAQQTIDSHWWQQFQSEELSRLIQLALENSPDLRIASERVVQAELAANSAGASLFPSLSLNTSAGASKSRSPSNSDWQNQQNNRASLGASYEVDLWGRVAASIASAKASFKAKQYDYESAKLSLIASVATNWFQYLSIQKRLAIAQENIVIAQRSYQIVNLRYEHGAATATDLANEEINLLTQQSALEPLQLQERKAKAAIAILVGQNPFPMSLANEDLATITLPEITPVLPNALLSRRPDLASAEAQLQAADANIKQARAALFPAIGLNLSAARSTTKAFSLSDGSDVLSIGASLSQVIFDRGRLKNQVKTSESQRIVLLEQYRQAIYNALEEVDYALDSIQSYEVQERQQRAIVDAAEKNFALATARYKAGSIDLMSMLDAQRTLFQRKDRWIQLYEARLDAMVELYKALGGGWSIDE